MSEAVVLVSVYFAAKWYFDCHSRDIEMFRYPVSAGVGVAPARQTSLLR